MANPQKIDAYLGKGAWDDYNDIESKFKNERARNDRLNRVMYLPALSPLFNQSWVDFNHLEKITRDYWNGLLMISNGRRPAKAKFDELLFFWSLAYEIAQDDNDLLDAMFMSGLVNIMMHFPFMLLEAKARVLSEVLKELQKELMRAEVEAIKAELKAKVHQTLIAFEILFPELSLTARAGIWVGEALVNEVIAAPEHPTTFQKVEGVATPGVKQLSETVHHIEELGHTAHSIAGAGAKGAVAVTIYLDYEEIAEATENKEKLRELVDKVNDAYRDLVRVIRDNRPALVHFQFAFERWVRAIEASRLETEANREKLRDEMDKTRYSFYSSMIWPGEPS